MAEESIIISENDKSIDMTISDGLSIDDSPTFSNLTINEVGEGGDDLSLTI